MTVAGRAEPPIAVSVVIVNWHSREDLRRCLASIAAHTTVAHEILVIDSGSFDGTGAMLRDEYPAVRFIQSTLNLGFARANNAAFAEARGASILFLNPDTELRSAAIDLLHARLTALPAAGAVGARLLNGDGSVQTSCIQSIPTLANQLLDSEILRRRWPRLRLWGMAPLHGAEERPAEVEAISGACLMVSRRAFEAVGRFSNDYFMYAEDMDLCDKLRRAGYRNYYVPAAVITHYGGSSSDQTTGTFAAVMMPEAICRFLQKTRGRLYGRAYRGGMLASAALRLLLIGAARALQRHRPERAAWDASHRKWRAVLRWAVHRDPLVKQYYMNRPG
jgi:N-acetylglucosaminyl-diphospho-decaprenol L-rhamnosyltransferase